MTDSIDNMQDIIDSRDVIARIEELKIALESAAEEQDDSFSPEEADELKGLEELAEQCEGYAGWLHGETLIRESYFTKYAQQLAEDFGRIDHTAGWPSTCIDWDKAAEELKQNYTEVDFNGTAYYIR